MVQVFHLMIIDYRTVVFSLTSAFSRTSASQQLPRSGRRVEVCAATSAATGGGYSPSPMAFAAVRFGIFLEIGHCLAPLVFLLLRARPRLANVGVTASVRLQDIWDWRDVYIASVFELAGGM